MCTFCVYIYRSRQFANTKQSNFIKILNEKKKKNQKQEKVFDYVSDLSTVITTSTATIYLPYFSLTHSAHLATYNVWKLFSFVMQQLVYILTITKEFLYKMYEIRTVKDRKGHVCIAIKIAKQFKIWYNRDGARVFILYVVLFIFIVSIFARRH